MINFFDCINIDVIKQINYLQPIVYLTH